MIIITTNEWLVGVLGEEVRPQEKDTIDINHNMVFRVLTPSHDY